MISAYRIVHSTDEFSYTSYITSYSCKLVLLFVMYILSADFVW